MLDDDKLDIKQALRAYQTIVDKGEAADGEHCLNGIYASTDFDGYTVFLRNDYVSLTISFHNKFSLEYTSQKEKNSFFEKLKLFDARKYTSH